VPKMISKHCKLVKLCHINRSGPVSFETQCIYLLTYLLTVCLKNRTATVNIT